MSDPYDYYLDILNSKTITVDLVKTIFELFFSDESKISDNEHHHMFEDALMRKFILDMADKKLTDVKTIQKISRLIKKINVSNYVRWYS